MAGTFPGVSGTQQMDLDGRPNAGAQLSVFMGGTNDLADTFQDIGLAIASTNPLIADATGRLPLFFVADGTYKVRLVDQYGNIANGGFEYAQCPSIGASSSGGGGTAVDATTVFGTGDVKARIEDAVVTGWVRLNGRTIGNATSGSSERASSDTQALWLYCYLTYDDTICPVSGGRTGVALTDYNAGKQLTLPDLRFRHIVGLDTMGNTAAGRSSGATFSAGTAILAASVGGEAAHALAATELPVNGYSFAGASSTLVFNPSQSMGIGNGTAASGAGNLYGSTTPVQNLGGTVTPLGAVTVPTGGNGHNTMGPFMTGSIYMKL